MAFSEGQAWEDADLLWSGLDSIKARIPEPIFAALRSTRNPRYFVLLNIFMFVCLGVERSTFYISPPIIGDFPLPRSAMSPWRPRRALLSNFSVFTAFAANAVINVSTGALLDPIKFSVGLEPAKVPLALGEKLAMFSAGPLVVAMARVVFFILRFNISAEKQAGINQAREERFAKARGAGAVAPVQ